MRTRITAAIVFILAVSLAAPTAAVALESGDSAEGVQFSPQSEYATVESGELVIDFERLNDDATTTVDAVFTVTASDETVRQFWVTHDVEGVTFYADGERGSELNASNSEPLTSGETIAVGMSIDTREAPTGTETVSMVIASEEGGGGGLTGQPAPGEPPEERAPVSVSDATIDRANVTVGETVVVTATVTNPHDEPAAGAVDLGVDGRVVADETVELAPGENRTLRFEWTPDGAGVHSVTVVGEPVGTVVVSDPTRLSLGSYDLASPLTAAVAPPATLGLLFLASVARGRRH